VLTVLEHSGKFLLASDAVSMRATLDQDIIPRNTWNADALAKSLVEIRHIRKQGTTVLCGHDDEQWKSLRKGADVYD
jgi:N-acyl homoserine lactone hydrolase